MARNHFLAAAVGALACALGVSQAQAATIVQDFGVGLGQQFKSVSINRFDANLGTLNSVSVTLTAELVTAFTFWNSNTRVSTFAEASPSLRLTYAGKNLEIDGPSKRTNFSLAPQEYRDVSLTTSLSQVFGIANINDFVGTTPMTAQLRAVRDATYGAGIFSADVYFQSGTISIAYDYAPAPLAAPVPEPATWAMMIAGFGMIGATARRRTRAGRGFSELRPS